MITTKQVINAILLTASPIHKDDNGFNHYVVDIIGKEKSDNVWYIVAKQDGVNKWNVSRAFLTERDKISKWQTKEKPEPQNQIQ